MQVVVRVLQYQYKYKSKFSLILDDPNIQNTHRFGIILDFMKNRSKQAKDKPRTKALLEKLWLEAQKVQKIEQLQAQYYFDDENQNQKDPLLLNRVQTKRQQIPIQQNVKVKHQCKDEKEGTQFNYFKKRLKSNTKSKDLKQAINSQDQNGSVVSLSTEQYYSDFSYNQNEEEGVKKNDSQQSSSYDNAPYPQIQKRKTKKGSQRKRRTTITQQKLDLLNFQLKKFFISRGKGFTPQLNLRQIAQKVNLSYSTTLHKASVFRYSNQVKPGVLITSQSKKRKYKKSENIERFIEQSLKQRPFYTSQALAKHILRVYGVSYSRSIIGRHLSSMGYSINNKKQFPNQNNGPKYIELRKAYASIMEPLFYKPVNIVYIDEAVFSKNYYCNKKIFRTEQFTMQKHKNERDYISIMVAMNSMKIVYCHIKDGFYSRINFLEAISHIYTIFNSQNRFYNKSQIFLISDLHKIHYDRQDDQTSYKISIENTLCLLGIKRLFLPPGSPQLNPVEIMISQIKNLLNEERESIQDAQMLKQSITRIIKKISNGSMKPYFSQLQKWLEKAKSGEHF